MDDVATAVLAYADRLHRALPAGHGVSSPLGAWLVLALAAPLTSGADRAAVESALGTDATSASAAAGALLADLAPAVAAAAACWTRPELLGGWTPTWPDAVATGPVPDQPTADAWTREHTLGLIARFPVELTPLTAFVLCSAVATRIRWRTPFVEAPAFGDWTVPTLASSPAAGRGAGVGAVVTTRVGDVGVWTTSSDDGLDVTSVIADRAVPAVDVLAVAHEVAVAAATGPLPARRSLFDLPLGATDRWVVSERSGSRPGTETASVALPAWEAESRWELLADPATGFAAVAGAIGAHLDDAAFDAVQVALARYGAEGFEAAAVTAIVGRAVAYRDPGPERHVDLRFGHPHAVVATATTDGPWRGLPVFAAWVAQASSPAEVVTGRTG